jgi:hypothetical protein
LPGTPGTLNLESDFKELPEPLTLVNGSNQLILTGSVTAGVAREIYIFASASPTLIRNAGEPILIPKMRFRVSVNGVPAAGNFNGAYQSFDVLPLQGQAVTVVRRQILPSGLVTVQFLVSVESLEVSDEAALNPAAGGATLLILQRAV